MEEAYAVKKKGPDGRYFTYGNVKKNPYGNYSLGLKVTPQLKALVNSVAEGQWLNLNMFVDDGGQKPPQRQQPSAPSFDDEVPF